MAKSKANKRVFTTGDIGKFVGVNFRTVLRWIQDGHLQAYQLPGRGDNRVRREDLLGFLTEYGMAIPAELMNTSNRVLIVESEPGVAAAIEHALEDHFDTLVAINSFAAGSLANDFAPAVLVINPDTKGLNGLDAITTLCDLPNLRTSRVLVVSERAEELRADAITAGAKEVMAIPFGFEKLLEAVSSLCSQV